VPLADVMLFGHELHGRWLLTSAEWQMSRGCRGVACPTARSPSTPGPRCCGDRPITRRVDPDATFDAGGERARRGRPVRSSSTSSWRMLISISLAKSTPERFGSSSPTSLLARVRKAGGSDNDACDGDRAHGRVDWSRHCAWGKDDKAEVVISGGGAKNPRS